MTYDPNESRNESRNESPNYEAFQDAKAKIREAYILAFIPIVQEGMALLAESIKDLRHEMALNRQQREECTPLERELRVKQLKAALEDFDVERAERLEANKVERERLKKFLVGGTEPRTVVNGASH